MRIQLSEHFTYSKLIKFTIPTIIMMIFSLIYGVIDGAFVSNGVGSDAFAAVNLIMPVLMILGSIGYMIGTGGSALVSKTIGEGDTKKANEYFSMLVCLLIIVGIILTIIGTPLIRHIAELLGADEVLIEDCVTYGGTLFLFLTPFLLQNCFQSFVVVAETPLFGLLVSIVSGLVNITLDFIFMYNIGLGVFGAALSTGISQIFGGVVPLIYFMRKNKTKLRFTKPKFDWKIIKDTCINGLSEMVSNLSTSLVNMLYNAQLMRYAGADGVVAYGIIMYISFIFSGTYMGFAIGTAPIISYHYGADDHNELKNLLVKCARLITIVSILMTGFAEVSSKFLASIFVSYDEALLLMTTRAIRIFALSYIISGLNIFSSSFFTALHNGPISTAISFLRTLLFQIAFIFILPLIFGIDGIWMAVVLAEVVTLFFAMVFLVKNRKKYKYG